MALVGRVSAWGCQRALPSCLLGHGLVCRTSQHVVSAGVSVMV